MAETRDFGSVTLFEQCPICHVTVACQIIGEIGDPAVDLSGQNVSQAMATVNSASCDISVKALVVHHDCREHMISQ
jgi:hypothetical protein